MSVMTVQLDVVVPDEFYGTCREFIEPELPEGVTITVIAEKGPAGGWPFVEFKGEESVLRPWLDEWYGHGWTWYSEPEVKL